MIFAVRPFRDRPSDYADSIRPGIPERAPKMQQRRIKTNKHFSFSMELPRGKHCLGLPPRPAGRCAPDDSIMSLKPLTSAEVKELYRRAAPPPAICGGAGTRMPRRSSRPCRPGLQNLYHNPVAVLHEVSTELRVRLQDPELASRVRKVLAAFPGASGTRSWASKQAPLLAQNPVACSPRSFAFHECLPDCRGWPRCLAGDHTKSASDLGLGFVGISLFYREGYFSSPSTATTGSRSTHSPLNPRNLPLDAVVDGSGKPIVWRPDLRSADCFPRGGSTSAGCPSICWTATGPRTRAISGPDQPRLRRRYHDCGSCRRSCWASAAFACSGHWESSLDVPRYEQGHTAFLTWLNSFAKIAAGKSFEEAGRPTREECIFTTHTSGARTRPFTSDLVRLAGGKFVEQPRHQS